MTDRNAILEEALRRMLSVFDTPHSASVGFPGAEQETCDFARRALKAAGASEGRQHEPSPASSRDAAFDEAWSAIQHSEAIEIKTVRRKLSIHQLRTFLQLVLR